MQATTLVHHTMSMRIQEIYDYLAQAIQPVPTQRTPTRDS